VAELLIAMAPLLALAALALTAIFVPLQLVAGFALSLLAVGALIGLPSGLVYHLVLRRELRRLGSLPRGWYWHPQRYHDSLQPAAQRRMRPWFLLGAGGFGLILIGFALSVLALAMWFRSGGALGT
jgi:hypothetical protein